MVEERRPSKEWPERGHIQFNGYQTRYRPGLGLVLKGITCDIAEGERVRWEWPFKLVGLDRISVLLLCVCVGGDSWTYWCREELLDIGLVSDY